MNEAFLECNIWSVNLTVTPYTEYNVFLVEKIYYYNSLTSGIIVFNPSCVQIPEFEIKYLHLLNGLNYEFINKETIPILNKTDDLWTIDLIIYNKVIENEYKKNINM